MTHPPAPTDDAPAPPPAELVEALADGCAVDEALDAALAAVAIAEPPAAGAPAAAAGSGALPKPHARMQPPDETSFVAAVVAVLRKAAQAGASRLLLTAVGDRVVLPEAVKAKYRTMRVALQAHPEAVVVGTTQNSDWFLHLRPEAAPAVPAPAAAALPAPRAPPAATADVAADEAAFVARVTALLQQTGDSVILSAVGLGCPLPAAVKARHGGKLLDVLRAHPECFELFKLSPDSKVYHVRRAVDAPHVAPASPAPAAAGGVAAEEVAFVARVVAFVAQAGRPVALMSIAPYCNLPDAVKAAHGGKLLRVLRAHAAEISVVEDPPDSGKWWAQPPAAAAAPPAAAAAAAPAASHAQPAASAVPADVAAEEAAFVLRVVAQVAHARRPVALTEVACHSKLSPAVKYAHGGKALSVLRAHAEQVEVFERPAGSDMWWVSLPAGTTAAAPAAPAAPAAAPKAPAPAAAAHADVARAEAAYVARALAFLRSPAAPARLLLSKLGEVCAPPPAVKAAHRHNLRALLAAHPAQFRLVEEPPRSTVWHVELAAAPQQQQAPLPPPRAAPLPRPLPPPPPASRAMQQRPQPRGQVPPPLQVFRAAPHSPPKPLPPPPQQQQRLQQPPPPVPRAAPRPYAPPSQSAPSPAQPPPAFAAAGVAAPPWTAPVPVPMPLPLTPQSPPAQHALPLSILLSAGPGVKGSLAALEADFVRTVVALLSTPAPAGSVRDDDTGVHRIAVEELGTWCAPPPLLLAHRGGSMLELLLRARSDELAVVTSRSGEHFVQLAAPQ